MFRVPNNTVPAQNLLHAAFLSAMIDKREAEMLYIEFAAIFRLFYAVVR